MGFVNTMSTATDFIPFFDYSLIEAGIQSHFVASGNFEQPANETDPDRESWSPDPAKTPFFTAFEAALFQKFRPHVAIDLSNVAPVSFQAQAIVDASQIVRPTLYRGVVNFTVTTDSNYLKHTQLRAYVAALAMEIAPYVPQGVSSTIGANQYLTHHVITNFNDAGQDTTVTPDEGYYTSRLTFNITFGWRRDKLPS